jgi:hypothetical protein
VGFVKDVNLEAPLLRGGVHRTLPEITGIVYPAIGCGVDLDDIEGGGTAPDSGAGIADSTGFAIRTPVRAIEGHCEDAGQRRLSDPARTAKEIGVPHPAAGYGPAKGLGDMLLRSHFREATRAIRSG